MRIGKERKKRGGVKRGDKEMEERKKKREGSGREMRPPINISGYTTSELPEVSL